MFAPQWSRVILSKCVALFSLQMKRGVDGIKNEKKHFMTHVLCPQQYCVSKTMYHHHTLATFRALSALWIAGNIDKIVQSSFKAPLPLWKTHTNISFWQQPQHCTCFFTELHCHSDLQNSFNLCLVQNLHVAILCILIEGLL